MSALPFDAAMSPYELFEVPLEDVVGGKPDDDRADFDHARFEAQR